MNIVHSRLGRLFSLELMSAYFVLFHPEACSVSSGN